METVFRATVAGIVVILSFHDENQDVSHDSQGGDGNIEGLGGTEYESCLTSDVILSNTGSDVPVFSFMSSEQSTKVNSGSVHFLEAMCRELVLSLQVIIMTTDCFFGLSYLIFDWLRAFSIHFPNFL